MFSSLLKRIGIDVDAVDHYDKLSDDEGEPAGPLLWGTEEYDETAGDLGPDDDEDGYDDFVNPVNRPDDNDDSDSDADDKLRRKRPQRAGLESGLLDEVDEAAYDYVDDDDEGLFSSSSDSGEEAFSEEEASESEEEAYENDQPYEFAFVEDGLFLLRVANSKRKFVLLARADHPLVRFTRLLVHNERQALRSMLAQAPAQYDELDNGQIPGVLTRFVVESLYRAPKFLVQSQQGAAVIDSMPANAIVPERPEEVDLEGDADAEAELFVLDPLDGDYEPKYQTLIDVLSGRRTAQALRRFENAHNDGNLARFHASGFRGSGMPADGAQFSPLSPVTDDAPEWYCVKMHYYAMYCGFMTLHDQSHTMLQDLMKRRQVAEETGGLRFCYGEPAAAGETTYTAAQERAVLDRVVEASKQTERADNAVSVKREEVRQIASQLVRQIGQLRLVKAENPNTGLALPLVASNPQETLDDVCASLEALQTSLRDLNLSISDRFEPTGS